MTLSLGKEDIQILKKLLARIDCTTCPKEYNHILKKIVRAETPTKVSSRKAKGRDFQQFIASRVCNQVGVLYTKDDQCPVQSRGMGQNGTDIIFTTPEVQAKFPYSIECKAGKSFNLNEAVKQAKANRREGTDWLLTYKRDREDPIAIISWSAFEFLLARGKVSR